MFETSKNCTHIWGKIHWGTRTERIPYGMREVWQGSDHWGEPEGYRIKEVKCQMAKCVKCGKIMYLN